MGIEKPAYENFDLEIKNDEELKEAKKMADVKSQEQAIKDEADFAAENNDETLFNTSADRLEVLEKNKKTDKRYEINIESAATERINELHPDMSDDDKERYSKRLKVVFDRIVKSENIELGNEENVDSIMDRAVEEVKELIIKEKGPKKLDKSYVVERGMVDTDIDKFKKEASN